MKEKTTNNYFRKNDNRYETRIPYGYKENGKIKYKSIYGNTREELEEKRRIVEEELKKNKNIELLDKSLFGHVINRWSKTAKIKCKESTYSNYLYTLSAHINPIFARKKTKDITLDGINNFTTNLLESGLSPKTVKDILIILQQILRFADINIKITMPKQQKKEIQIYSKEDQKKLEIRLLEDINTKNFGIFLCLYSGLRIGELCALTWKDIDLENQNINIKKTITRIKSTEGREKTKVIIDEPKSVSSIRTIPIPHFIYPYLKLLKKDNQLENFFLSNSKKIIETRSYYNYYKKITKKAGIDDYNFHALRHTFATRCIENGFDPKTLSEILGHSNVKITLERYVHPNYETKVKLMNQLVPMYD